MSAAYLPITLSGLIYHVTHNTSVQLMAIFQVLGNSTMYFYN